MRRIYLMAVLCVLGLAAIASTLSLGVGRASAERASAERRQIHTLEVLVDAKSLSVAARDMQRGQRGYLLTENPDYLAPYEEGTRASAALLAKLREDLADNPRQQAGLDKLALARDDMSDVLARTVELAQTGRRADALALVRSGEGRRHMQRITTELDQIMAEESRLLDLETAAAEAADARVRRHTRLLTLFGAGLLAIAAGLGAVALRGHVKRAEIDTLMRTVLRSIHGAVFAKDKAGRYTLMSEVGARLLGRPVSEILGRTDPELVPPLFAAQVAENEARAIAHGGPLTFEEAAEVDGRDLLLSTTRTPFADPDGDVSVAGVALDVTAQRETEAALVRAEAEARAVFNLATVGIAQADAATRRLVRVNAKLAEITGYAEAELIGMSIDDLTHPDDREADRRGYARLLAGESNARSIEKRYLRKDGATVWVRANVALARASGGAPLRTLAMVEEIGERMRTEEELTKTGALLRAIIEASPGLIYAKDREGRMILANGPTLAVIGKPWERVEGRTDAEFLNDPAQGEAIMVNDRRVMDADATQSLEESVSPPDGAPRVWLSTKAPLRDPGGAVIGMVGVSVDITARKEAEAELRGFNETLAARVGEAVEAREAALAQLHEAQKLETIGQLTGGVAHDFNNLLVPIVGGLDMLRYSIPKTDERGRRLLSGAQQAAERARVLVSRLLTFARRQKLEPQAVDLRALTAGMADLIGRSLGPTVEVSIDVAPDLPPALVDPNQLELALLNLAVNARDAMPGGGTLSIGAREEAVTNLSALGLAQGRYLRLSVVDAGTGMDADTLKRALEPFFSTKAHGKGTGLGLSIAHGLAVQSGGALKLSSELGVGTRVEMWLPAAEGAQAAVRPSTSGVDAVEGAREQALDVLLVDDEELVRAGVAEMLLDLGHRVVQAASGGRALDLLREGAACDLLVTDHLMPGMSGVELAKEARRLRPELPALLITGYANMAEEAHKDLPWLSKPFRQGDLAARVGDLVGSKAA